MTFQEFNAWALAKGTVCKTDGTFCGECVSLINQYLSKVHNIQAGAWGHAKAWANQSNPIRGYFTPVTKSQAGDIGVDTAGTYGHIWIYRDKDIIEQNGRVPKKVTISPDRNATVILRPKAGMPKPPQGGNMPSLVTAKDVPHLYSQLLGRGASAAEIKQWTGIEWSRAFYEIATSPEGTAFTNKVRACQAATPSTVLKPGKYEVK